MIDFLKTAIRDRNVGAMTATSPVAVRSFCKVIPRDRPQVVVEYGPGNGAFTRHLVSRLHPGSTVIAIELNGQFVEQLHRRHERWERVAHRKDRDLAELRIVEGDACDVSDILADCGHTRCDFALSGIPFTYIPHEVRRSIVAATHAALTDTGTFLVYQYTYRMKPYLQERFADVTVDRSFANIPPMCLMRATKS